MHHPSLPFAEPVDPTRVRTLPRHFAWVDHRLRERLRTLSLEEIALLFFLHLAADERLGRLRPCLGPTLPASSANAPRTKSKPRWPTPGAT